MGYCSLFEFDDLEYVSENLSTIELRVVIY
jgi:hypothetical protein